MRGNKSRSLQSEKGTILKNESKKREFLDRCEADVSKVFEKRQAEETRAYNKQKDFVIRWPWWNVRI